MADGLNKIILIGNLGKDPVYRVTPSNRPVAEFSLATTESWRGEDGNRQTHTEWHRIVVWGPAANAVRDSLKKGSKVYVEGSLRSRKWKDKEGNERTTVEVQSTRVLFLSGRSDAGPAPFDGPEPDYAAPDTYGASPEDDIPF